MNDGITRRDIAANGITLHIAELGQGPLLLLCHGWPELGYSWRHQMAPLAAAGYRVVAPDMRGYGGSSAPQAIDAYAITDLVGDMVALVAALGETRAAIVGHDWGAMVAWSAALMRPDLFQAVAALSVPFRARHPPGAAAGAAARRRPRRLLLVLFQPRGRGRSRVRARHSVGDAPRAGLRLGRRAGGPRAGPDGDAGRWLPRRQRRPGRTARLAAARPTSRSYAAAFRKSGFRGGFNWYRNLDRNWALTAPFQGAKIQPPALFIAGTRDGVIASKMGRKHLEQMDAYVPQAARKAADRRRRPLDPAGAAGRGQRRAAAFPGGGLSSRAGVDCQLVNHLMEPG